MMGPLFFINPFLYMELEHRAAKRHKRVLGTANDPLMDLVYPIATSPLRDDEDEDEE